MILQYWYYFVILPRTATFTSNCLFSKAKVKWEIHFRRTWEEKKQQMDKENNMEDLGWILRCTTEREWWCGWNCKKEQSAETDDTSVHSTEGKQGEGKVREKTKGHLCYEWKRFLYQSYCVLFSNLTHVILFTVYFAQDICNCDV